ncbi:MAG: AAC(3) family N-acetyltransferase [Chloroflexota bacterium]
MTSVDLNALIRGLRGLELNDPVIAHASLSAFGEISGGAQTLVKSLVTLFPGVIMPAFTYRTMVTPTAGPAGNGITYGAGEDHNKMAEFYSSNMSTDRLMGIVPESLRHHLFAKRSLHPILSFTGIRAETVLATQTMDDPLAPVGALTKQGGWVLLLGVNHTVNTSIHFAEKLARRRQFTRWALTPQGVRECPGFPGCSAGFEAINAHLDSQVRRVQIGNATVQAVPLMILLRAVIEQIKNDPLALLCQVDGCERCNAVREDVAVRLQPGNRLNGEAVTGT